VADSSPVAFRLDANSARMLATTSDAILIGVVETATGMIRLFVASALTDPATGRFSGHRDLIHHSAINSDDCLGFSLEVRSHELHAFYRSSVLNDDFEDFAIPEAIMMGIINAMALRRAGDFRSYPREQV